ncbi:hypothetical protein ACET3Z_019840 [Daucus carota]
MNRRRFHDWVAENLLATGSAATYQTTTIAVPYFARKQGFYTVTCNPKNIEHILRTRFDNYPKGPTWQTAFHDLLGQGIFNSDGETWLIQRKTAALEFTTRTLRQAMARLKKTFGIGGELKLKKCLEIVENYMTDTITARKESPSDDLLSRFMKKKDAHGRSFPSHVLKRIALNFVLAGRDTSSVAMSWFFWLVMNNPNVERKIISEISRVLSQTRGEDRKLWVEEPIIFDEADKLIYLKAALAETLRLYPSVPEDFKYVVSDDVLPDGTCAAALPAFTGSGSPGRTEDVTDPVHEEWVTGLLESTRA